MTATYPIDNNVPLPFSRSGVMLTLSQMEIGQSAFIPGKTAREVGPFAHALNRRTGMGAKFTSRTVTENNVRGVRVWRVAGSAEQ